MRAASPQRGDIGKSKQGDAPRGEHLLRPGDYFDGEKEKHDAYAMVDGVTPEQFDAAIEEAKVEGNLSPLRS